VNTPYPCAYCKHLYTDVFDERNDHPSCNKGHGVSARQSSADCPDYLHWETGRKDNAPQKKHTQDRIRQALYCACSQLENGGPHLGVMRRWIQRRFRNGDRVTWGSDEHLTGSELTPRELDQLAVEIKNALVGQIHKAVLADLRTWHPGDLEGDK
jgi:hypothetical protein